MERVEPKKTDTGPTTRVWSVREYSKRHQIGETEQARLLQLFGPFATACELMYNAKRNPKWR
ncbi:hypothetical protein EV132_12454 [Rhizobium sullae]|uniref:Uncharacterized protein n=1 Tax=Rhizobium sullae TaxID=50338 RepID=A0A4R3PSM5_RHISU|nr:hypothetical protein [Rhizobium sullae]TCU09654.1 hypothetical protein EV132_12454 [Rhizobium sullae]